MKKATFILLMCLLPVVLLLAAEGVLRVSGVGEAGRAVFIPIPGKPSHQALNPAYVGRYFQGFAPAVAFHPFAVEKPADAFRVVVLGGSSAAGFPYHFYHSFSEGLRVLLQRAMPGRPIEVVNLGMSAVNSFTLWDLHEAVRDAAPDAVVIYAGHNEYYGALGVGSSEQGLGRGFWLKRLSLSLNHWALYTALADLLAPLPAAPPTRTMMARVVADAAIDFDGDRYRAGLAQYEHNMHDLLRGFADADIPAYVGLLASNLKDQPPLGDTPEAAQAYAQGLDRLAANDTTAAEAAFQAASDLDGLRFRAPSALNRILRHLAADGLATLVDIPAVARAGSTSGLPDDGFFDDHLHPNAAGHAAMASAFFEALRPQLAIDAATTTPGTDRLDPIEAPYAALQVGVLEAGYPFNKTRTDAESQAAAQQLLDRARRRSPYDSLAMVMASQEIPPPLVLSAGLQVARQQHDTTAALALYRALLHWQPFNASLINEAVAFALEAPHHATLAEPLLAFAWAREDTPTYLHGWAALRLQLQDLTTTDRLLTLAEQRDPEAPVLLYNKARLLVLQGDTTAAREYFARYQARRR